MASAPCVASGKGRSVHSLRHNPPVPSSNSPGLPSPALVAVNTVPARNRRSALATTRTSFQWGNSIPTRSFQQPSSARLAHGLRPTPFPPQLANTKANALSSATNPNSSIERRNLRPLPNCPRLRSTRASFHQVAASHTRSALPACSQHLLTFPQDGMGWWTQKQTTFPLHCASCRPHPSPRPSTQHPLIPTAAGARLAAASASLAAAEETKKEAPSTPNSQAYDAVVVGAGIGGVVAATQLALRGAKVLLLEKYIIPGGSSGYFERDGYVFDVGSSVMFGFGDKGNVNLITRALAEVGKKLELIPDPVAVHYHMPGGLSVPVHRDYEEFLQELVSRFPHEEKGIRGFYGECWTVFNALNALELKSLEEPLYLFGQFFRNPVACLTLAYYLPQNAGDIARKHIRDPELLSFIDAECFIVSTVDALRTPMINAAMVMCDRHHGGINYPRGGVGRVALALVEGLQEQGGEVWYKANVKDILLENGSAVGVRLADGREVRCKSVISNATRWDTFEKLIPRGAMPDEEAQFQKRYIKSPSFLSIHMGVDAEALPPGTECHHLLLEDSWSKLEDPYGTIFLSIPTILDDTLAPPNKHILHIFTTAWIQDWEGLGPAEYKAKKEQVAGRIIQRLEGSLFPGLKGHIHLMEVGTPKTHRRYLARDDGTYGPIPRQRPLGLLGMPFNTTAIPGLYCVGDSCFPGQGVIAVAFSGIMCGHRVAADLGLEPRSAILDEGLSRLLRFFRTLA